MYSFSVTNQLIVFLESFGFGLIIGLSENIMFCFCGLLTGKEKICYIISDVLLSLFITFSVFCFILSYNLGVVRFYLVLGLFFGIVIYELSFAGIIRLIFEKIFLTCKACITFITKPFSRIISKLNKKICLKTDKKSDKPIANKNNDVV